MDELNSFVSEKDNGKSSPVLSFYERLADLKKRVGFEYICFSDKPLAHECCLVICEVLHRPCGEILIGGEYKDASLVAEVFSGLTYEHLQHVCDSFNSINYEVKRKKQYLRSALYNSVFELEAAAVNDVCRR